ncbi:MAG: iron-sulfur cluster assembly accessory protein [Planctomycetes bacterium]|nr:iron-sulfur cluster assembly accessory protein [Planctomycetota bacterium]
MSVILTEKAAKEVQQIVKQNQSSASGGDGQDGGDNGAGQAVAVKEMYLRVGVKGGGCSGFSYTLDVTETKNDNDEMWDQHGVNVICDPRSYIYLKGTTVDFRDEMMGRGFVFSNPNATSSCGCGSSFSA